MITPEKNEVDISKLFQWRASIELETREGEKTTVFVRVVGDAEINQSRVKALRASAELRNKLRDPNSDERIAYIPSVHALEKENLIEMMLTLNMREYADRVRDSVIVKEPKEPGSNATTEQLEKYQKEVDDYPDKRLEKFKEAIEKETDKERKLLNKKGIDILLKEYEEVVISQFCEAELNRVFLGWCVYFGTFATEDYNVRVFKSYDEYENLPAYAKTQLTDFYNKLQLGLVDLKK